MGELGELDPLWGLGRPPETGLPEEEDMVDAKHDSSCGYIL